MIKFEFLGRGSAFNYKEGCTSAYLKKDDMILLIDCGRNTFDRIMELNLLDGIKELNILITHFHTDHCGSLGCLLSYTNYILGFKSNVYFDDDKTLEDFMRITGSSNIYNNVDFEEIKTKYNIEIDCFAIKHVDDIDSYGYEFHDLNDDNYTIYTGDTYGDVCDILRWVGYADVIYHDCCLADYEGNVHTSINKLCNAVPHKWNRQNVYLMHLDNNKELIKKAKKECFNVVEIKDNLTKEQKVFINRMQSNIDKLKWMYENGFQLGGRGLTYDGVNDTFGWPFNEIYEYDLDVIKEYKKWYDGIISEDELEENLISMGLDGLI